MQAQDHKKIVSSGPESHGVHLCHKCGWPFPNPHPSARHRRAHKRVCGTTEGYKTQLDGSDNENLSDDDSKTPSMEVVEKAAGVAISQRSSSGVGSRSSRSNRSEEDVFSDAVADFADTPATVGSVVGKETADVSQVTQLDVEKTVVDAGDLYPVTSDNRTQVLDVECSRPEMERVESESAHHSLVGANVLQCSEVSVVLASASIEATVDEKSEDDRHNTTETFEAVVVPQKADGDNMESIPAGAAMEEKENQGDGYEDDRHDTTKTLEAVVVSQKANGDNVESIPAGAAMEEKENQGDGSGDEDDYSPEVNFAGQINSSEMGMVEAALDGKSEDIAISPADNAGDTSEVISAPQKVNGNSLEFTHANATMEDKGRQGDKFDANNDCFPEANSVGPINSIEDSFHVLVVPDALPLKERSEDMLEDYKDCKSEQLPDAVTLDLAKEVECVEHGKGSVSEEALSGTSLAEPSEIPNKDSEDIFPEIIHQEDDFAEEVTVEKKMERTETLYFDTDSEQNSRVFDDTVLIEDVKPVHDDSERDEKGAQIFDALGAESTEGIVEQIPLTSDNADYDLRSLEAEEKLSGSALTVAQSDERVDDKVEVQRDDGHEFEAATSSKASLLNYDFQPEKLQDSEAAAKDVGSSDAVDVSLINNAMNNGNEQDENEVYEDAKDLESFGEKVSGEECLDKFDRGLVSNKDDTVDLLTQTTANRSEAGVHVEALSAVEDRLAKEKNDGDDGNLAKKDEASPELDAQVDSVSLTDSLEANWGSVSVLSAFSDAPVLVEKASLQPESNNGESDIFKAPYITASTEQKGDDGGGQNEGVPGPVTPEANAPSSGSKKNEEIIAKVTNWSTDTGKQHMPLKSFLGESSPNPKGNRAVEPQKTEQVVTVTKEAADDAARGEMPKEWSSPARYPADIKREKGKVRSRPYWAPFICCSSVQTS